MSGRLPGKVRIVAGSERGRRIEVPAGAQVRPTSEKVREAVFAALGPIEGLSVLDLFAGTGALGLEALSRGAAKCVFVESDPRVGAALKKNIASLACKGSAKSIMGDYLRAVDKLLECQQRFELLFIDPPYRMLAEVGAALVPAVQRLLSPGGVAVIEGPRDSVVDLGQEIVFEREYGDTKIIMVRVKE